MKKILISLFFINIFSLNLNAVPPVASAACTAAIGGGSSAITILMNGITSIYNMLPIKISGVPITPAMGLEDYSGVSMPMCICPKPWPIPGLPLELWEVNALIDVSNIPNCVPTLGMHLPIDIVAGSSFQEINKSNTQNKESYQITYIDYPLFSMLSMFLDVICLTSDGSIDIAYISTIDPLWQNDNWSLLIHPDSFLFANPIAQFACIGDAVTSQVGFPLDPLYWCMGSWNQTFPLTKTTSGISSPEAAMAIATKTLFKLHRQFMLWGSVGATGLCSRYPMPIMMKSQYMMYPIYPFMTHPKRIPIGRSGLIWSPGQDVPVANSHVWTIMTYKKRNCCAF